MSRRKEFKTIAEGLISSFVSRNNDVYGYWGIGKLYAHMIANGSMRLVIDLVNKTIEPADSEFEILISELNIRLLTQIEKRKLSTAFLKGAQIIINGFPETPSAYFGRMAPHKVNCVLKIRDDLNRVHQSEAHAWCREHDPNKELKSARKY